MDLAEISSERLGWKFKGVPSRFADLTVGDLAAAGVPVRDLSTPLLTLDADALDHNLAAMAEFCRAHGVSLAPHGKTTMAPQLFARQIEAGAWGITCATPAHLRVYRAFGVPRVFYGNELVDADALAWLAAELDADPGFEYLGFVDSVAAVALMDEALHAAGSRRPVEVVLETGAPGGRCGVRDRASGLEVAEAVRAARHLRLAGVAGFEGAVPGAGGPGDGAGVVRAYLEEMRGLTLDLAARGHFAGRGEIVVSAGGSAWFDLVLGALTDWPDGLNVHFILRSGAYITHDDGLYLRTSPFNRGTADGALRPALRLRGRVVSVPEPGLAVLDFGKRDAPIDKDLPTPLWGEGADGERFELAGAAIEGVHDQHMTLRFGAGERGGDGGGAPAGVEIAVGDVVTCGVSHPCTAFDKWQLLPVVRDGVVVDLVRTYF